MDHRTLPRKKRNIIWKIEKSILEFACQSASTLADVLKFFDLKTSSRNYKILQEKLQSEAINYSHIPVGLKTNKGKKFGPKPKIPTEAILVVNSTFSRVALKARLLRDGLLKNICYICGQHPEWNNKPLVLQIDHINGIKNDNRLENLRILCPHCHSQTSTFSGRNINKKL